MIQVLALDIDGVLTDGKVMMNESGCESKSVSYQDIDAIFLAKRQGLQVVFVTGEASPWVDMIVRRLEISRVYRGAKDKGQAVRNLSVELGVSLMDVCYVGDSLRDADALAIVGLGLAPSNATRAAQAAADRVLMHRGGEGAIAEAVEIVLQEVEAAHKITSPNRMEHT